MLSKNVKGSYALEGAVILVSAATLVVEIALTRVFSLAQGYHFAFLSVSLALLGFGVSGSFLGLFPAGGQPGPPAGSAAGWRGRTGRLAAAGAQLLQSRPICSLTFAASVLGSYLAANHLPFDSYRIVWEPAQWLYFVAYYALLSLPFFFSGVFVGFLLASRPSVVGRLYAANMVGAALGSLVAVAALPYVGAPGEIALAAGLGLAATSLLLPGRAVSLALLVAGGTATALLVAARPAWLEVQLSPYQALSHAQRYPDARVAYSGWSPLARIDVLESAQFRSFPGLSLAYAGGLPPQLALFVDGDNPSPLTKADVTPTELLGALPSALGYRLVEVPRVLLLEPRGGLDGLLAQRMGARSVTAVEGDDLVGQLAAGRYASFLGGAYSEPQARLVYDSPRSYLARSDQRFDLIVLPLGGSFRPVSAGAWALSEDYLYTAEAFQAYYDHLSDGGLLLATRWLQTPPSEELRAWAMVAETVEAAAGAPSQQMAAYRTWSTVTILASRSRLRPEQIATLKEWVAERSFDVVYYPGVIPEETNRYNLLPSLELHDRFAQAVSSDRQALYAAYPYDVSPPTDDRPFFHHFFRWSQMGAVLERLGKTWQPFGGSGFLLLLGLLLLVVAAAASFIIAPLLFRLRPGVSSFHALTYFALLGFGFLLVEIPLVQKMVLLLGHPTRAFAATVLALLLFSGIGSLASGRLSPFRAAALAALAAAACPAVISVLSPVLLSLALPWRFVGAAAALAPLGFVMGMPFPRGLLTLGQNQAGLIPWAWGINGFASVASSVISAIVALTWGFSEALLLGATAYALAAVAGARLTSAVGSAAG